MFLKQGSKRFPFSPPWLRREDRGLRAAAGGHCCTTEDNALLLHVFWRHRARSREEGRKARRRRSQRHAKVPAKRSSSAEVQASQTLPLHSFLSPKEVVSITHWASLLSVATGIWARSLTWNLYNSIIVMLDKIWLKQHYLLTVLFSKWI